MVPYSNYSPSLVVDYLGPCDVYSLVGPGNLFPQLLRHEGKPTTVTGYVTPMRPHENDNTQYRQEKS